MHIPKRYFIIVIVLFFHSLLAEAQPDYKLNIFFKSGSSIIEADQKESLDSFLLMLTYHKNQYRWSIIGHTDNIGGELYNDSLSQKRSLSVFNFLNLSSAIDTANLILEGKGYKRPIATNENETGRGQNRRVELSVELWDSYLSRKLSIGPKHYCFNVSVAKGLDTTLVSGTHISIPPNAFAYCDKRRIEGEINFCITEYRGLSPHILSNYPLSFENDQGEIMVYESGGMFKTEALKDNDTVCVVYEKGIGVDYANIDTSKHYSMYEFNTNSNRWVILDEKVQENKIKEKQEAEYARLGNIESTGKMMESINYEAKKNETKKNETKKKPYHQQKKNIKLKKYFGAVLTPFYIFSGIISKKRKKNFGVGYLGLNQLYFEGYTGGRILSCEEVKELLKWGAELAQLPYNTFKFTPNCRFRFKSKYYLGHYPKGKEVDPAVFAKYNNLKFNVSQTKGNKVFFSFVDDSLYNSELNVFRNYTWYSKKKLGEGFFSNSYNDVRIYRKRFSNKSVIEIKNSTGTKKFKAKLYSSDTKIKIKKDEMKILYKQYSNDLRKRDRQFNNPELVHNENAQLFVKHSPKDLWYISVSKKDELVNKLSYDQWLHYFNDNKSLLLALYKKTYDHMICDTTEHHPPPPKYGGNKKRYFQLSYGLGAYNFDTLMAFKNAKTYDVTYYSPDNKKLQVVVAYLFDQELQALIRIKNLHQVRFNPKSKNKIVVFDNDENMWIVGNSALQKMNDTKSVTKLIGKIFIMENPIDLEIELKRE